MRSDIKNCHLITLPFFSDSRGDLVTVELNDCGRVFWVIGVPPGTSRGNHARRKNDHLLICLAGIVNVTVDDGIDEKDFTLSSPNIGLFVPAMIWGVETYAADSILLVFNTEPYNPDDYIRDYEEYKRLNNE